MLPKTLRVSLRLEENADAKEVLAAMEEALGHPVKPLQRLRSVPILSVLLTRQELEQVRCLRGIRSAAEEKRAELPPTPRRQQESR